MGCVPQGCTAVLSMASFAALSPSWRWEPADPALHMDPGIFGCRILSQTRSLPSPGAGAAAVWLCTLFAAWPFPELGQDQVRVSTCLGSL